MKVIHKTLENPSTDEELFIVANMERLLAGLRLIMVTLPPNASERERKSILLSTAMNFLAESLHEMTRGDAVEALAALDLVNTTIRGVIGGDTRFSSPPSETVN